MPSEHGTSPALPEEDGLIFACTLDGRGGATPLDWWGAEEWARGQGPIWLHLDRLSARVQIWLRERSELKPRTIDALLSDDIRPHTHHGKTGTTTVLRAANIDPQAAPSDLVCIRIWCDGERLLTLRHLPLKTPREVFSGFFENKTGPTNISETFERIISRMTWHLGQLTDRIDGGGADIDPRETAILHRHLTAQHGAVRALFERPPEWLGAQSRLRIREAAEHLHDCVERLDALQGREVASGSGERGGRRTPLASVIAKIRQVSGGA